MGEELCAWIKCVFWGGPFLRAPSIATSTLAFTCQGSQQVLTSSRCLSNWISNLRKWRYIVAMETSHSTFKYLIVGLSGCIVVKRPQKKKSRSSAKEIYFQMLRSEKDFNYTDDVIIRILVITTGFHHSRTAFTYKLQLAHFSTNVINYILTHDERKTLTFRGNS